MPVDRPLRNGALLVYRHPLLVRAWHWLNLACLIVLLLSGLQILCAHPAFYWGETSRFAHPLAAVTAQLGADGETHGALTGPGFALDTTGLLGVSRDAAGQPAQRAFPAWLTLPSGLDLGAGRRWHFFFAWIFALNGAVYLVGGLIGRRLPRALLPTRDQLRHIGRSAWEHLRLRFPRGDEARAYNVLQKLVYLPVVFGLLPLMVATGLTMSPTIDAAFPLLTVFFGGRQGARTLHFVSASGLVLFALLHVAMVLLAGPINELRSMITGWFVIRPAAPRP